MEMPWPVDVPLIQDELLSSWIIRTAFENGSYPLAWSWYFWGKHRVWTKDIDRFCPLEHMSMLVTPSVTLEALKLSTLYPWLQKIVPSDLKLHQKSWPWVTPLGTRNRERTGGLRFCPMCLASPPVYYRRVWRFSWNHSCVIHRCILQDTCPNCSSSVCPHKLSSDTATLTLCAACGYDLSNCEVKSCSNGALELQILMNTVLDDQNHEMPWGIVSSKDLFETIRYLMSFINRAQSVQSLADTKLFEFFETVARPDSRCSAPIERLSVNQMHALSEIMSQVFKHSDADFSSVLSKCGYSKRSLLSRLELPVSPQVQGILDRLPERAKIVRRKVCSIRRALRPMPRSQIEKMWLELQGFLT